VPNPYALLDSLARFASVLTSGYGVGDVLHDLTEETTDVLSLTGAGVALVHDGKQRFVTAAIDAIANLERVQENHQAAECIDAVTSGEQPRRVQTGSVNDYAASAVLGTVMMLTAVLLF